MPLSETVTSIGEGILLVNWIVEGNFRKKWEILKQKAIKLDDIVDYYQQTS